MNIFVMALAVLFIGIWFFVDSPSQKIRNQDLASAIEITDLRSIVECAANTHGEILAETTDSFKCTEKYKINTNQICVDARDKIIQCVEDKNGKFPASFIVTAAPAILDSEIHQTMKTLQELYPTTTNFGILGASDDKTILMAADGSERELPTAIIKEAKLANNQIIYITKIPVQVPLDFSKAAPAAKIICNPGEAKVIKQGQWQCISVNPGTVCTGDTIWSSTSEACVPDPRRRPLCTQSQTAVQVDDHWECIDPLQDKPCNANEIARMNYTTMMWECIADPGKTKTTEKCRIGGRVGSGGITQTVRMPVSSCTDCEDMVTDPETCETKCVPAPAKINDPACYRGRCTGSHQAFYFGFPNVSYYTENVRNEIPYLKNIEIPGDGRHSQNRRFNCLDCGTGYIDNSRSHPPYVAVCVGE